MLTMILMAILLGMLCYQSQIDPAMDEDDKPAPYVFSEQFELNRIVLPLTQRRSGAEPSGPVQLGIGLSDDEEADDDDVVWD